MAMALQAWVPAREAPNGGHQSRQIAPAGTTTLCTLVPMARSLMPWEGKPGLKAGKAVQTLVRPQSRHMMAA